MQKPTRFSTTFNPKATFRFHFQFEDFYISFFNYWQPTAEIMYDFRPQVWLEDLLESIFSAQKKLFDRTNDSASSRAEPPAASIAKDNPIFAVTIKQHEKTLSVKP